MSDTLQETKRIGDGRIITVVKGALIGIANIIPGVSGGTFALILGVFDRLVSALNAINLSTLRVTLRLISGGFGAQSRRTFGDEWRRIDMGFIFLLALGAGISIFASSFLIDYLLKAHYSPTLAFFVGLILPSVAIPWAMMSRRGLLVLWAIPGIALTMGVSLIAPNSEAGWDNPLIALGTGAIAVSAMILPGLSGSYVMLVLGQYQNVLAKLTGLQLGLAHGDLNIAALTWLAALGLGIVIGIILFARLLHFLLDRFRSATMAFLIGLLLGSLWVLWPFKEVESGAAITDRSGEVKEEVRIATAPNRLPGNLREGGIASIAFIAGLGGSAGLIALGRRKESKF